MPLPTERAAMPAKIRSQRPRLAVPFVSGVPPVTGKAAGVNVGAGVAVCGSADGVGEGVGVGD
jgi:hypothetical protein